MLNNAPCTPDDEERDQTQPQAPIFHSKERKASLPIPIRKPKGFEFDYSFAADADDQDEEDELARLHARSAEEKREAPSAGVYFRALLKKSAEITNENSLVIGSPHKKKGSSFL